MRIACQWQEFISAEAGFLPSYDNQPVVVIAFGGTEGPVTQFVLSIADAQTLVEDVLAALAQHGDEQAQRIFDQYRRE